MTQSPQTDPYAECEHGMPAYEGCWECKKQQPRSFRPAGATWKQQREALKQMDPFASFR